MKIKKCLGLIIVFSMALCSFTACGESSLNGDWTVYYENTPYSISIDNKGEIRSAGAVIGSLSEDKRTITLQSGAEENISDSDFGTIIEANASPSLQSSHTTPAEPTDQFTFEEVAYYLGVSKNVAFKEDVKTEDEFKESLMHEAVLGNYIPYFKLDPKTEQVFFDTDCGYLWVNEVALALPELMGSYSNVSLMNHFSGKDPCTFFVSPDKEVLSQQQIYNRQIEAIRKALEINENLRAEGKLKDSMSDKDKAMVFANYLKSLNMDPSMGGYCPQEENMYYDSAFSGLVQNVAACGGRAAAYNVLLRTEGIACSAIGCTVIEMGAGHYINRMILDGKECFYDWYNEPWFPKIMTKDEAEKVVCFYDGQYEYTGAVMDKWLNN